MLGNSEAEDLLDDLMAAMNKLASAGYPVTAVSSIFAGPICRGRFWNWRAC